MDEATLRQVEAADPGASTWLSANAGSGKTKVLTDRVARLLLHETPPQRILCLTYTKAAASEMQNRLFRRLGEWAMLPDAELIEIIESGFHKFQLIGDAEAAHWSEFRENLDKLTVVSGSGPAYLFNFAQHWLDAIVGMGIDRIVSLLTEQENLRDVVLFPIMKSEKNNK